MSNKIISLLGADGTDVDLVRELELANEETESEYDGNGSFLFDHWNAEIAAHKECGFSIPTREELIDTSCDFFVHLMMERE